MTKFKKTLINLELPEIVTKIKEVSGKIAKLRLEILAGKQKNLRSLFFARKQQAVLKTIVNLKLKTKN